jgi:hypothetical protein
MALLVNEDQPKNAKELSGLLGDFLTDGMTYTEEESFKTCTLMFKQFNDANLMSLESRDTIIAEKLSQPITMSELIHEGHHGIVREDDFYDPLLAGEKNADGNYNHSDERIQWANKKLAR